MLNPAVAGALRRALPALVLALVPMAVFSVTRAADEPAPAARLDALPVACSTRRASRCPMRPHGHRDVEAVRRHDAQRNLRTGGRP